MFTAPPLIANLLALTLSLALPVFAQDRDHADERSRERVPTFGSALRFDGVDDVVTVPASVAPSYAGAGGWTIELWVKATAYPASGECSVMGQESVGVAAHDPYSLRVHPGCFEFRVDGTVDGSRDKPGEGRADGTERVLFDLPLNEWRHVACVYANGQDGRWVSVYVNGRLIVRRLTEVRMESRHDPVYFGRLTGQHFAGLIDEARVWSVPLDAGGVGRAMRGEVDPRTPGLRGWWGFDEGGPVALDRSRFGAHAVLGRPDDAGDTTAPDRVLRTEGFTPGTAGPGSGQGPGQERGPGPAPATPAGGSGRAN